jgi:hypothetical protein
MIEKIQMLTKTTVPEGFHEAVLERLKSFGVTVTNDDAFTVAFSIDMTANHIKNTCNTDGIPEGLFNVGVDMVCGDVLEILHGMNKLNLDGMDLGAIITQIKEGDTSVSFDASATDSGKLRTIIDHLMNGRRGELLCYRKMTW